MSGESSAAAAGGETRRRVVVTGAAGYIAGLMLPGLRTRYDLTLLDVRGDDRAGNPVAGLVAADLTDNDRNAYRAHFAGADAVVHCAFVRPPDAGDAGPANGRAAGTPDGISASVSVQSEARFRAELANVAMAYNVFQTAREEGVRRVVMISSNHAADYYEPLILDGKWDVVTPDMQERAVGYYGWAKATYEHLGFIFAQGGAGEPPLENVQIRIGGPRETDLERAEPGNMRQVRRGLAVYLSRRDLVQLIVKSIETADIRDRHGVPFQVFYGISGNSHAFWSIANARRVIGYAPQDNSELRFHKQLARHLGCRCRRRRGVSRAADTERPARVADVFRGHKLLIGLSAASGLLFAATTLIPPLYVRRLIAAITGASAEAAAGAGTATGGGGADGVSLGVVIAVLVGVFLLRGAARYFYGLTSHQAAYALLADLLQRVYRHLQQLSHRFFAGSRTGTLIARSVSDVESLEDFVAHGVPELVQAVAIPLAMIVVLVAIDPLLTLVVLSPLPVAALVIYLLTRNIRGKWRHVRERYADVVALVEDSLQGMSEIKSFTREAEQARRVGRLADDYRDDIIRATNRSLLPSGIVEMTGGLGVILAVGVGGADALGGGLQVADLYLFLAYLTFIYQPFLKLADIGEVLFRALASYRRIDELFAVEPDIVSPSGAVLPASCSGSVALEEVTFSYRPGEPVLHRIDLAVAPGEVVSLAGPTGAGKTTVTRLVPRFYDPDTGRVLVGGHDVRSLDLAYLRRQVAAVSQDVFLFHGSVRDNILFGRPDAGDEALRAAARAANAEEFIRGLPDRYDTVVGDRGVRLSGGQRQRVAIARALLKDAPILILDEATSSVDAETEELIQEAMARLLAGRTALVIAHRRSTIERADRVVVLEAGRVIESGTAAELLAAAGRYRSLIDAQLRESLPVPASRERVAG